MSKKRKIIILAMVLSVILLSADGLAATVSQLNRIRSWQHKGFTRLVLDVEGVQPLKIGPATAEGVMIIFKQLELMQAPSVLFGDLTGAVASVNHHRQANRSVIAINFKNTDTVVKSFYLSAKSAKKGAYRLIMDLYPPGSVAAGPGALVPVATATTAISVPAPATTPPPGAALETKATPLPAAESTQPFTVTQLEAPQTASTSPAEGVELASGKQKQKVPPAESPSGVRAEGEKLNLSKLHQSERASRMVVTESSANRNKAREGNDQTIAVLTGEVSRAGRPDHIPSAQASPSGIDRHTPADVKKATSGDPAPNDIVSQLKNTGGRKKELDTAGKPTPFKVEARSVTLSPAVQENGIHKRSVCYKRNDPRNKQKSMGLVELTLKLLSISLSCLVILCLYRANKIATHRYQALKQIQQRLEPHI